MTITQISETAGCSRDTVKRLVKTMFPNLKSKGRGIALDLDKEKCLMVMDKLPKKNYVNTPSANAPSDIAQNTHVDYEAIGKMIAIAVSSAIAPLIKQIQAPKNEPLQIEHVPEKTSRAIFKQEVDKLVAITKSDWSAIYNAIYAEMGYVYGVKVKARAINRKARPIDVLESDGLMGKAIAITRQMIERLK